MKIIRKILIIVCIAIFVYSAYNLGKIFLNYYNIEKGTKALINEYVQTKDEGDTFNPLDRTIDFKSLQKRNSDVIGWIYIPDTKVDEALLKGSTNDTYLRSDIDKKYNYAGSIFLDASNNSDLKDMNSIIYGHNMKNGSRFHDIRYYVNEAKEYSEKHPTIYIYLPDGSVNCYQVFASGNINEYSDLYNISNDYDQYIKDIKSQGTWLKDIDNKKSPIIMLSTCNSSVDSNRYVVWATLTENLKK